MARGAADRTRRLLVVKIGGSLIDAGKASAAIAALPYGDADIVIVPGGGTLADRVRSAQIRDGFSDGEAHRRALLAMNEMADMVVPLHRDLALATGVDDISDHLSHGRIPVFAPWPALKGDALLPETWDATSDAVAARVAERLGADCLLLKAATVVGGLDADALSDAGIVDGEFPHIVRRAGLRWLVAGPETPLGGIAGASWRQG